MNKYEKWYSNITENAIGRTLECYTENHHIHPKALGGPDEMDNMVALTAREHFICHWLLIKMYPIGRDHHKMLHAIRAMRQENPKQKRYKTKITARVYANLKEEYSKLQSEKFSGEGNGFYGKQHTEEAKRAISEKNSGRIQPHHEKEKQIAAMTGRKRAPFSDEWRQKMSESKQGENNNMFGKKHNASSKKLMSIKASGRKQSAETIKKKADAIRGLTREKKLCPHCKRHIAVNTYTRWHGKNCKSRKSPA